MKSDGSDKRQLQSSEMGIFRHPRSSPDAQKVSFFVTGDGKPYINLMNADGTDRKRLTSSDETSRQASWGPDGDQLVYSKMTETFDLWIMSTDGTGAMQLTSLAGDEAKPVFSPDGKLIVFVCFGCENETLSSLHVNLMVTILARSQTPPGPSSAEYDRPAPNHFSGSLPLRLSTRHVEPPPSSINLLATCPAVSLSFAPALCFRPDRSG